MNIQIVAHNNEAGLTKDRNIIKNILEAHGHKCFLTDKEENHYHSRKFDINIFIEHLNNVCVEKYVPQAKKNILIPNPEWFEPHWKPFLPYVDAVFCKTQDAVKIFSKLHKNVIFTSFTSDDKRMDVKKEKMFFHSCGKSHSKGTDKIIKGWMVRGELPMLHLCAKEQIIEKQIKWSNITHRMGYMKEPDFTKLQNRCWFHLCPSIYEGFGHYIWEALSMGNIVITTNSPPMSEFVGDFGIKLMYQEKRHMRLAEAVFVHAKMIVRAGIQAGKLPNERILEMSKQARHKWATNDQFFRNEFIKQINQLKPTR